MQFPSTFCLLIGYIKYLYKLKYANVYVTAHHGVVKITK